MRAARHAAVALALALLLASARSAHADDALYLPQGTEASAGLPPYVPGLLDDAAALRAWCAAAVDAGRALHGTRPGGDLLLSAACALDRRVGDRAGALALYAEAADAYPPEEGAAGAVAALLGQAHLLRAAGDVADCRHVMAAVEQHLAHGRPVDLDPLESGRWALLETQAALVLPRLQADLLEHEGRLDEAAAVHERLAEARADDERRAVLWARAAQLRARSGSKDAALDDIGRALEATRVERNTADWSFWRLHLIHDRLDDEGAASVRTTWPGETFARDVRTCLDGLRGNPHTGAWLLTVASTALASGEHQVALDLYLEALSDPTFVDMARGQPHFWRGLLAAFPAALARYRIEDAERILAAVDRIGDIPREELDGYRVALAEARDELEAVASTTETGGEETPTTGEDAVPAPSPDRGLLRLPEREEAATGQPSRPESGTDGSSGPAGLPPAWFVLAIMTALLLSLLFVVFRRLG